MSKESYIWHNTSIYPEVINSKQHHNKILYPEMKNTDLSLFLLLCVKESWVFLLCLVNKNEVYLHDASTRVQQKPITILITKKVTLELH